MRRKTRGVAFLAGLVLLPAAAISAPINAAAGAVPTRGGIELVGERAPAAASAVAHFRRLSRVEPVSPNGGGTFVAPLPGAAPPATIDEPSRPSGPAPAAPQKRAVPRAPSQPVAGGYAGLDDIPDVVTGFRSIPPDTDGAVGLTKVMETLNNNFRVRDKATGTTLSTVSSSTFWTGLGGTNFFDPKTLYDPLNDRWIMAMMSDAETASSSVEIAVSKTSDPEGAWWTFRIDADSANLRWADFPSIGFNKNWVAVNVNMFRNSNNTYVNSKILVVDYPSLRGGTYSGSFFAGTDFATSPAETLTAGENTLYMTAHLGHFFGGNGAYHLSTITGTSASPSVTVGTTDLNRGVAWQDPSGNIEPQAAPSAGASICGATPCPVDSGDSRIGATPIVRGGFMYYAQAVGMPSSGAITHTAALWTKLDASGGGTTGNVVDGGLVEDPTATASNGGKWYAYPSVAVNLDDDVMMGFSQFASNQWPSGGYSIHLATDGAGTMRDPVIYKAGEDYYHKDFGAVDNRWGDYSTAQVDPSNDTDLWALQEYAKARVGTDDGTTGSNSSRWGTWWAKVSPHLPAINWDPSLAANRVANRPLTCNTPVSTCTDSGNAWLSGAPSVAASNNGTTHYVHAVWNTDAPTGDEGNGAVDHTTNCSSGIDPATGSPPYCSGVFYSRSSDGGATWNGGAGGTAPFAVSPTDVHAGRAAVATSGAHVYVAYVTTVGYADKMCANDARVLYVRANSNYGAAGSWSAPVRLTSLGGRVDLPVISASGPDVYVVHTDSSGGQIVLDRSTNNGTSFASQAIGHTSATFDNGLSPGTPTCPSPPTPSGLEGFSGRATVAGDGTTVGAAWMSNDGGKAVAKISADDGATWPGGSGGSACPSGSGGCTMHLTPAGALGAGGRSLVASTAGSGRVAFAWVDDSAAVSPKGLYVRVYTAAGGWAPKRLVSCMQNTASCTGAPAGAFYNDGYSPSIAVYGTTGLGVAWSGCPNVPTAPAVPCDQTPSGPTKDPGAEILWKESWDNGATWSAGEGPSTSYRLLASDTAANSAVNERVGVVFDTASGAGAGCLQQPRSLPVGIPEIGCKRYVLYAGRTYGGSVSRLDLSIGTQVPG